MKEIEIKSSFKIYSSIDELNDTDKQLLTVAKKTSALAYAPYSQFKVGAVLKLNSGEQVIGSNQENASFPVGICAERVALANLSSLHAESTINTIAIYVNNAAHQQPAAPCGMCRQALYEQETRQQSLIRILLKGNGNEVIEIDSVKTLLPLGFSVTDLKNT
jgi:cytidine deaminase